MSDSLKQIGSNIFGQFLQAGQGILTEQAKTLIGRVQAPTDTEALLAERQKIDAINGSGAPSTREALKAPKNQTDFVFNSPVKRADETVTPNQNMFLIIGGILVAFFFLKKG